MKSDEIKVKVGAEIEDGLLKVLSLAGDRIVALETELADMAAKVEEAKGQENMWYEAYKRKDARVKELDGEAGRLIAATLENSLEPTLPRVLDFLKKISPEQLKEYQATGKLSAFNDPSFPLEESDGDKKEAE